MNVSWDDPCRLKSRSDVSKHRSTVIHVRRNIVGSDQDPSIQGN